MISIVIPCYRSEATIAKVVESTIDVFESNGIVDYEFILVNDGSGSATYSEIERLAHKYQTVKGVDLAVNVGQQMAMFTGMRLAEGNFIVTMDDDLQTDPTQALKLLKEISKGESDFVIARYERLEESGFRSFASTMSSRITPYLTGRPRDLYVGSFFAITKRVKDEIVKYRGTSVNIQTLAFKLSRNPINVVVEHHEREVGSSGYTLAKLIRAWKTLLNYSEIAEKIAFVLTIVFALLFLVFLVCSIIFSLNPWAALAFVSLSCCFICCLLTIVSIQVTQALFSSLGMPQYSISSTANVMSDDLLR